MSDYCELCDLPLATCIHGRPPPEPAKQPKAQKRPRSPRAKTATTSTRTRSTTSGPAVRTRPRRWTPPDAFRPHILRELQEAGGELEAEELFAGLEARVAETLLDGDRERTPEGELRWRYAARRARQALIADGVMTRGTPGVWVLSAAGMAEPTA